MHPGSEADAARVVDSRFARDRGRCASGRDEHVELHRSGCAGRLASRSTASGRRRQSDRRSIGLATRVLRSSDRHRMNATEALDWTEANQRFLAAELRSLKRQLEARLGATAAAEDGELAEAAAALSAPAAIDEVVRLFELSPFERQLLLLCAGVELDGNLAATCARIHG